MREIIELRVDPFAIVNCELTSLTKNLRTVFCRILYSGTLYMVVIDERQEVADGSYFERGRIPLNFGISPIGSQHTARCRSSGALPRLELNASSVEFILRRRLCP